MRRRINAKLQAMTNPEQQIAPSLLRRITAMLYDALLVVALVAVVNALALAVVVRLTSGATQVLDAHMVQLLVVLSTVCFFTFFWVNGGQTLGMQAWRIKLLDFNGNPPTASQALRRCCGAVLSAACLGMGFWWCLVDHKGRYWHDYLSGTELILLPKHAGKATAEQDVER
jgi:uncharacterized RDD family membrane protein YckC